MAKVKLTHSLKKGDHVQLQAQSMANGGDAIGRFEGLPIFVERGVPGDDLEVRLFDVRKDFAHGEIATIHKGSEKRTEPLCHHFERCGGCQWQHIKYEEQLNFKRQLVVDALGHVGAISNAQTLVRQIIGADDPFHYRNKMQFPTTHKMGQVLAGYYERGSHDLVNIEHCPIQPAIVDEILHAVRVLLKTHKVPVYLEEKHAGLVRHTNVRVGFATGQILVSFVVNHEPLKYRKFVDHPELFRILGLAQELVAAFPAIVGVVLNFNPHKGNRILGDETLTVLGLPHIEEVLKSSNPNLPAKLHEGLKFQLSSNSFFQVNTHQAEKLLEVVAEFAKEALHLRNKHNNGAVIVDAYAGVGTIALWLSPMAQEVIAIEEVDAAVKDGEINANLNGIGNVSFICGKVEAQIEDILQERGAIDLLVLDPPRKGAAAAVIEVLKQNGPKHIIYVSCNPASLARDLKMLSPQGEEDAKFGYIVKQIQPLDLFPQTYHVESIALLERIESAVGHLEEK